LVTSFAWFKVLERTYDFRPSAAAGHSLGEYSALLAAGAMTLTEAARLVRTRGEMMQTAVPAGVGKMAALLGLTDEQTRELCERATEGPHSIVVPANFNSPGQVVIAGHATAVERAEKLAGGAEPSLKARKVISLKVSAPFHCPLMKPVAENFVPHLQAVQWRTRSFPVAANLDAKLRHDGDLIPLLRDQIDHPVLWTDCAKALGQAGHRRFVEMGPGKVLTGLVKRIVDDSTVLSVDSLKDLQTFEATWREAK
jgi:[acyl-carrier-protein] S-malonyltransferase